MTTKQHSYYLDSIREYFREHPHPISHMELGKWLMARSLESFGEWHPSLYERVLDGLVLTGTIWSFTEGGVEYLSLEPPTELEQLRDDA